MAFKVTPTDFKIGPSVACNRRPEVTADMIANQAEWRKTVNFRKEPLKTKLTQTDFYQLVMANLFHQVCNGQTPIAHFEVFIRKLPADREYMIFSGLHDVLHWLLNADMDRSRMNFVLSQLILRDSNSDLNSFRKYLKNFRSNLDVWSYPEGSFFMPMAPYVGISGPVEKVLLAETYVLSVLNSRAAFSTRAAQYRMANPGMNCIAMEMRRMDAELSEIASFEARKQGFIGTSNTEGGYQYSRAGFPWYREIMDSILLRYINKFPRLKALLKSADLPPIGTNSHAMYMAFDREIEAIRAWMDVYPNYPMVLTDTYHTLINALKTAAVLREKGMDSISFRVDSGNLFKFMGTYKRMMAQLGIDTKLRVGTNDLTPLALAEMLEQECNANAAGIGTKYGEVPATPGVLKLSEIDGPDGSRFICKISVGGKASLPGIHQVWRSFGADGRAIRDVVALLDEKIPDAVPMMKPFTSNGYLLAPYPDKQALREQFAHGREQLPASGRYPVEFTPRTLALKDKVAKDIEEIEIVPYQDQLKKYVSSEELSELMRSK